MPFSTPTDFHRIPASPNPLSFTVIGGGISSLSLSILLAQSAHTVTVLERRPAFDTLSAGGGLNLTANAVQCLYAMGLEGVLEGISEHVRMVRARRGGGGEEVVGMETRTER